MSRLEELIEQKKKLEAQIDEEKGKLIYKRMGESIAYRKSITPEIAQWLLDHTHHTCCSCSDENPCNGFFEYEPGNCRCTKCALMEYLDEDYEYLSKEYAMNLDVHFSKIEAI